MVFDLPSALQLEVIWRSHQCLGERVWIFHSNCKVVYINCNIFPNVLVLLHPDIILWFTRLKAAIQVQWYNRGIDRTNVVRLTVYTLRVVALLTCVRGPWMSYIHWFVPFQGQLPSAIWSAYVVYRVALRLHSFKLLQFCTCIWEMSKMIKGTLVWPYVWTSSVVVQLTWIVAIHQCRGGCSWMGR